ncbi:hypothetical protein ACT4UL_04470, partial [Bacillus sp. HC-TM]
IVMIATLFTGMIFFSYAQRQQAVRADQPNITGQYGVTIITIVRFIIIPSFVTNKLGRKSSH